MSSGKTLGGCNPQPRPQTMSQPTTAPPSTRLQQASQLNMELQQRGNTAQKRREQIAMNEAEQVRKFTKPTLQEQLLHQNAIHIDPMEMVLSFDEKSSYTTMTYSQLYIDITR